MSDFDSENLARHVGPAVHDFVATQEPFKCER
jgi:hypothetical protein